MPEIQGVAPLADGAVVSADPAVFPGGPDGPDGTVPVVVVGASPTGEADDGEERLAHPATRNTLAKTTPMKDRTPI
jgi:hypothetical protein